METIQAPASSAMSARLMKSAAQSLTEQLAARFAQRIRDRLLAPGARLPSVRQCAQQQGVSPATVVGAYQVESLRRVAGSISRLLAALFSAFAMLVIAKPKFYCTLQGPY